MDKIEGIIRKNLVINAFDNLHEKPAQASQEIREYIEGVIDEIPTKCPKSEHGCNKGLCIRRTAKEEFKELLKQKLRAEEEKE
jgi:hypothetical protein